MRRGEIAIVRWGSPNSRASLYGSALTLKATGEIEVVNRLMPSGTTLQEWYSYTDYQSVRGAPSLPLLHHGKTYRIDAVIAATPADSVIFDVRYYDRFNGLLRTEVLYAPSRSFEYPADCHHYTIRLLNAGCDRLEFASFALLEVDEHGQQ
ncbi:accessory Sec system protein Asp3 [Gryllotalpicola protaetiae]|uniref:Accessory Sec system protein Asp3 n=1 Tax=Gryllotalpicola protaetiae TaxID=2419771 RepID=A0A387BWF6_9MICO|nr:accessory Sec system protein Asp3 [Gryllotalpicola protaetiae]AYG05167.1 accessory Sec system protein Asp3 [Gryllotalpicola protaetiae]